MRVVGPPFPPEGFLRAFKLGLPAARDTGSCESTSLTSRWRCSSPCRASCLRTLEALAMLLESQASGCRLYCRTNPLSPPFSSRLPHVTSTLAPETPASVACRWRSTN